MKVILFVPQLSSGGAQQVAVLLASGLIALGHEVIIAAASLHGELIGNIDSSCCTVDLKTRKPIRSTKKLAELVNRSNPDAVICFGIYTGIAAALSKKFWRWKSILLVRNENNLEIDWQQGSALNRIVGPPLSRWAARNAHIVAVSHSLAPATSNYLRISSAHVATILNPVFDDTRTSVTTDDSSLHPWLQDRSVPTFVAMGRLEPQKGFDILIEAFSRTRSHADARLVIFGSGSLRQVLQSEIDAKNMQNCVVLAGHTNSPMQQMGAAHAFVLSSRFEGFGLVLVEALWSGTRVISTDCNYGPADVLEGGRYGTLVPVDDPEALASAMLASISNSRTTERPSDIWFGQFTATEAARQHVALIKSLG